MGGGREHVLEQALACAEGSACALPGGYWGNPEALRGGWLHMGDVGVMDDEGCVTLKDRSRDMIISGGTNIYPQEVEEVLLRHPSVREALVIGRPDPEWGENIVAYIVPSAEVDRAELDRHCLESMARFKRPKAYRFVEGVAEEQLRQGCEDRFA